MKYCKSRCAILAAALIAAMFASKTTQVLAQGPSSRGAFTGPPTQMLMREYADGPERWVLVPSEEVPIPDLFRMEAPFVERNLRFDYLSTNHLHEPLANESQFFGEINFSFNEQWGILFGSPFLIRDNFESPDTSGFGDVESGIRYVAIGYEEEAPFKMAYGLNVISPTGDVDRELGDGVTFLEPEILMLKKLRRDTFVQTQLGLEIPTESNQTTVFSYSFGIGRIYPVFQDTFWFRNPTPTLELNCETGVGGVSAGESVVDITPGLRWMIGQKTFAGVALSVPLSEHREFETQFIFSLIRQYGPGQPSATGGGGPSSRGAF